MAILLRVNGRDLSGYLRPQHDQGLDPASSETVKQPEFGGSLALGDGQPHIRDAAGNREWDVPVILKAASVDALHELDRAINADLFRGAQVEFRPDGATLSTFFDLEAGRLDVDYQHFLVRQGYLRCMLRLWTRPFGHTATARAVASAVGSGPLAFLATGVLGDQLADVNWHVHGATRTLDTVLIGAAGASYVFVHPAASIVSGGAVAGASGAIGSQYAVPAAGGSQLFFESFAAALAPAYEGQHRMLVVYQHPATIAIHGAYSGAAGDVANLPTVLLPAAPTASGWRLADLGEISLTGGATGGPARTANIRAFGPVASCRINAVLLLPSDRAMIGLATSADTPGFMARNVPEVDFYCGDASTRTTGRPMRGAPPKIAPTGSPVASGPRRLFAFAFNRDDVRGNEPLSASVTVRERFAYFR